MQDKPSTKGKRKRKRKIKSMIQGTLVISGVILVVLICLGELMSFSGKEERRQDTYMTCTNSETENNIPESRPSDTEETALERQTENSDVESENTTESERESEIPQKSEEEKLAEISANEYRYPEKILGMLDKNIETLDFVYDYPEKQGSVYTYALDEEDMKNDGIPLLIQWDERWGYGKYGENIVGTNGCGPACMAMVIAGLTGNTGVTPYTMAIYSEEHGYLTGDGSTMWSFITDGGEEFGVLGQAISLNEETVIDTLEQGFPVICSVRPGDFTDSGHFIVLTDYAGGKIKVNDPYSYANSEKLWEFEVLQPQIKNLWKMYTEDSLSADYHL